MKINARVRNLIINGKNVNNHYIISIEESNGLYSQILQSYNEPVIKLDSITDLILIDSNAFNWSKTTTKYINAYLKGIGCTDKGLKEIRKEITIGTEAAFWVDGLNYNQVKIIW